MDKSTTKRNWQEPPKEKTQKKPKKKQVNRLSKQQKDFCDEYIKTGNGRQSALKTYNTENGNVAGVIAYDNLKKPQVIAYLDDKGEKAGENIYTIANDKNIKVDTQLKANIYIYDQVHGKAEPKSTTNIENQQINIGVVVLPERHKLEQTSEIIEDLSTNQINDG